MNPLQTIIEQAWENRALLQETTTDAIREVIELLDTGKLRVAEPVGEGWQVNEWLRKRSLCTSLFKKWKHGNLNFEYHDKMLLKSYAEKEFALFQTLLHVTELTFQVV
jgi:2,3,4,5-tetrahydropyridine-2-carboxylate N-succinyltransferase